MKPQHFLRTLEEMWPLVSGIWERFESRAFAEPDLYRLAQSFLPRDVIHDKIARLVRAGILAEFRRGGSGYQINNQVLPIIQFLLNEQNLGLLAEISLNADQLLVHRNAIEKALLDGKRTEFMEQSAEMQARFSHLGRMCEQNRLAIFRLADLAKQADISMPLSVRYAKVLQAWDEYIAPALKMRMPGDRFDEVLRRVMRDVGNWLIDDGIHLLSHDQVRYELEVIQYRLLDFKEQLDFSVHEMARYLAPLVRHVRINTSVARGAALCLRALTDKPENITADNDLRLPAKKRFLRKASDDQLAMFYVEFMTAVSEKAPDELVTEHTLDSVRARQKRSRFAEMTRWLRKNRPVHDVVAALQEAYEDAEPLDILKALNHVLLESHLRRMIVVHPEERSYLFEGFRIRMRRRSFELQPGPFREPPSADTFNQPLEPRGAQ